MNDMDKLSQRFFYFSGGSLFTLMTVAWCRWFITGGA